MKTRNGFVSNSSSSSFVIVVPTETYDKVVATLSDLEKRMVKHMGSKSKTLFGKNISVISGVSGNYDSLEGFDPYDNDGEPDETTEEFDVYGAWEDFVMALKIKAGDGNFFTHEVEWL